MPTGRISAQMSQSAGLSISGGRGIGLEIRVHVIHEYNQQASG